MASYKLSAQYFLFGLDFGAFDSPDFNFLASLLVPAHERVKQHSYLKRIVDSHHGYSQSSVMQR